MIEKVGMEVREPLFGWLRVEPDGVLVIVLRSRYRMK